MSSTADPAAPRESGDVEESLRESEARLSQIIASAMEAIITTDADRRIIVFNRAAEQLFRVPAAEAIGTLLDRFIPERYRGGHAELMRAFGETGSTIRSMHHAGSVLPALRADGQEFPVEATISHALVRGERLFTVMLRDVTDRITYERQRADALEEAESARAAAEAANRAKADFLATMSHELRTPLNAILGYAELLELGVPDPIPSGSVAQVERIQLSAKHLLRLIEEILTFSRLEARREEVGLEPVRIDEMLREVEAIIEPLAAHGGIDFAVVVEEGAPESFPSDARKVRQAVLNLLGNAVKFTERGRVELRIGRDVGRIYFRVSDTGIGIPSEHIEHLFEPFWQADASLSRISGGAGLGLAITERFARLLGGEIEVRSDPGRGSDFTLWLPLPTPGRADGG